MHLLFSINPNEFGSALRPLRQALLGTGQIYLSFCTFSVFFCPFVGLGSFSSSSGIFLFLFPFTASPLKTDSLAKALINTFALRCKWLIKDVFLLPGVLASEQRYVLLRVEFQIGNPGGREAQEG